LANPGTAVKADNQLDPVIAFIQKALGQPANKGVFALADFGPRFGCRISL
jgi:hypothetical protein